MLVSRNKPDLIRGGGGVEMGGLGDAVTKEFEPEGPFEDLVAHQLL